MRISTQSRLMLANSSVPPPGETPELYALWGMNMSNLAICFLNLNGKVIGWNLGAEKIFGYTAQEAIGTHFSLFYDRDNITRNNPRYIVKKLREIGSYHEYGWRIRKDGTRFFAKTLLSIIRNTDGKFKAFGVAVQEATQEKLDLEKLSKENSNYKIIFNSVPAMIWYKDKYNRILHCNESAAKSIGKTIDEVEGKYTQQFYPEEAAKYLLDDLEVIESGKPKYGIIEQYQVGKNRKIWVQTDKLPFRDETGSSNGVLVFSTDITQSKLAEDRLKFLCQASGILASSIDYQETLHGVSKLAVPFLADICLIDIHKGDGKFVRVEVACADPRHSKTLEVLKSNPPDISQNHPYAEIFRTGNSAIFKNYDITERLAKNPEHRDAIHSVNAKQCMVVPLVTRGRILGLINYISAESGREYSYSDLNLAEELARRAAAAIDNAVLYQEAQSAIKVREDFLSIASHELKTPLTTLTLQVQLIRQIIGNNQNLQLWRDKISSMLEVAGSELNKQAKLIDNLMNLTRIQTGYLSLERETIELSDLVKCVVRRLKGEFEALQYTVQLESDERVFGCWDRVRIEQVVINLLSNAIKYGQGKPIHIRVSLNEENARLIIRDQGLGIPKEMHDKIFKRFERASLEKKSSSLGLGLYIVKQIVEAHGGQIQVESEMGSGSAFIVELPRDLSSKVCSV